MRRRYGVCDEDEIVDDRPEAPARTPRAKVKVPKLFARKTPQQWFTEWNWRGYPAGPDCNSPEVLEYMHYLWHTLVEDYARGK